jgi:hypothetical protein
MPPAAVYRFTVWDQNVGDNERAPRFATLPAIERVRGMPLDDTMRIVDSADIDSNGFYPKPKVWLIEIFDLVSRTKGNTRVSVPEGEYTMREVNSDAFEVSGGLLPFPFEWSHAEISNYLQGKIRIVAGGPWP